MHSFWLFSPFCPFQFLSKLLAGPLMDTWHIQLLNLRLIWTSHIDYPPHRRFYFHCYISVFIKISIAFFENRQNLNLPVADFSFLRSLSFCYFDKALLSDEYFQDIQLSYFTTVFSIHWDEFATILSLEDYYNKNW